MLRPSGFYEHCLFVADVRKINSDNLICKHFFSEPVIDSSKRESK